MDKIKQREQLGKEILQGMYREGMILTWYRDKPEGWKLASGLWSPYYVNMRLFPSFPYLYRKAAKAMSLQLEEVMLENEHLDSSKYKVVGIAMAGIAFADAMSLKYGCEALYTRKLPEEVKTPEDVKQYISAHGQHALVEGEMKSGDVLVLFDDLVTRLDSKLLAKAQVDEEVKKRNLTNVTVKDIVVLLDREQGAAAKAESLGLKLRSFIPFASKGVAWLQGALSNTEYDVITNYMKDNQKFQEPSEQARLAKIAKRS